MLKDKHEFKCFTVLRPDCSVRIKSLAPLVIAEFFAIHILCLNPTVQGLVSSGLGLSVKHSYRIFQ